MEKILRLMRRLHIGLAAFMALQIWLIVYIYGSDPSLMQSLLGMYAAGTLLALSPIGEFVLCLQAKANLPMRRDIEEYLAPIITDVLARAHEKIPSAPQSVRLRMIDDPLPCACAIGWRTLAVSEALLSLPYSEMEGVIANEIAHLAKRHNVLMMIAGCSNPLFLYFWLIVQAVKWIFIAAAFVLSIFSGSVLTKLVGSFFAAFTTALIWVWTTVSALLLAIENRQNVYEADRLTFEMGYGDGLASALDSLKSAAPGGGMLKALYATHPSADARIAKLMEMGVSYRAY